MASCNGPGGKAIQLKFRICKGFILNFYHFSAQQVGGKGAFFPPQWSQGESSISIPCLLLPPHRRPPRTWKSSPYGVARGTSEVTGKFPMQDLLASCSGLWKTENHRDYREKEDYYDYLLFVNNLLNLFYTWKILNR